MGKNEFKKDVVEQQLIELRHEIDAIDLDIVNSLGKRKKVVDKIVAVKRKHQLPIYHPAREEDLISDRRGRAIQKDIDPDYAEELFRTILRYSRTEQASKMTRKAVKPEATILIVGGKGSMGQYFRQLFEETGYHVRILARDDWADIETLALNIDLALISVPIESTNSVISKLGPYLPQDCILSDITSIKESPLEAMLKAHQGPVVGFHPLFGPSTSTLDKQIIVVTPGRNPDACQWLLDQLSAWGSIILKSTAKEHDEVMGIVQTLRHFATFAFGQFLHRKQINLQRTLEFSSPIYRLELGMVGRLFAQDPSLYAEIIFASPDRRRLLKEYLDSIQDNLEMIEKGEKERFQTEFNNIAEWFGPFGEQAMRESSYLIDKLIERF